jgi:hypothetical protein
MSDRRIVMYYWVVVQTTNWLLRQYLMLDDIHGVMLAVRRPQDMVGYDIISAEKLKMFCTVQ